jgi:glycosyltransferase involved in cell wall biosynthesis
MRVGIDYLPAVTHAPGVGRYLRELVRALVRLPGGPELALAEVGRGARTLPDSSLGLDGARASRYRLRLPRRLVRVLARAGWSLERALGGCELFHRVQADWPPSGRAVQVLAVTELPRSGSPIEEHALELMRSMHALLVFSRHAAVELVRRTGVDARRVREIEVGCDHWVRDLGDERVARVDPPRLLVLGGIRVEREPLLVLAAFERLLARGTRAELVFAGHPGSAAGDFERAVASSPAREHVRWIRAPEEARMPRLVAESSVLVHLAREESTPVTPLEACAMGLAVLADPLPAFQEALGAAALWTREGSSAEDLARRMEETLGDARDGARTMARRELARHFTWERNAARTLALWQEVAGFRPSAPTPSPPAA